MGDRGKGDLEEAMKRLNLSAADRRGIKVGKEIMSTKNNEDWHAVGKVMSEKMVAAEGIMQTLGRIWCGDRGMICKEMGDNLFLFRFNHPAGRKKALEDGPWMAGHSLLVMVAYDGKQTLESMDFNFIPIWIHVSSVPMGMMNKVVAEMIGNEVGSYLDVDVEENGSAVGRYLRIKVRIDIRLPIMRMEELRDGVP
ncbi:hypothetical protein E2562_029006 [Oryza meyeriana var. granulata]|uniref:DUF4283 domain-containing protein n=1 Tax=Oryza meyeriana var. granulata TaxID=110450 RepID=A0A6G1E2A5_9ORYZ|nr:hypothetical protein E2562_029006 [Oryza meyeriana var. granulata]